MTIFHSKQRLLIIDDVEKLLVIWIRKKELDGICICEGIICEKALCMHADLLKVTPSSRAEGESGFTFKVSRCWFEKYEHRSGIHGVVRHGEAAN